MELRKTDGDIRRVVRHVTSTNSPIDRAKMNFEKSETLRNVVEYVDLHRREMSFEI